MDGVESVLGIRYGKSVRSTVSTHFNGQGIKGAEAKRLALSSGTTDMLAGIDRLSMTVQGLLALNPFSGHLFVFCNRRRDAIKVLYS